MLVRPTRGSLVRDAFQTIDWEPPDSLRGKQSGDGLMRIGGLVLQVVDAETEVFAIQTINELPVLGPRSLTRVRGAWHAEFDVVSDGPRAVLNVRLPRPGTVVERVPARSGISVMQLLINAVDGSRCSDEIALAIAVAVRTQEQAIVTYDGDIVLSGHPSSGVYPDTTSAAISMFGRLAAGYPGDLSDPRMMERFTAAVAATTEEVASFVRSVDPVGWLAESEYREQLGMLQVPR